MKNTLLKIATVLVIAISMFSCSPEDGKDGINGTNGETGTANVIYSSWLNQNWNNQNTPTTKQMRIVETRVTTDIINNGFILGYWRFSNQQNPYSLPSLLSHPSQNIIREMTFNPSQVFFTAIPSNSINPMNDLWLNGDASAGVPQFRYIIVPGGVPTSGGRIAQPDYSKMSYHEICTKFNIPE